MERKLKRLQAARNDIQYITWTKVREELSPFVFFDAGAMTREDDGLFIGMHPHSGIGIITYFEGADLVHDDSGKNDRVIKDGGVQWICAGGGVWHQENYVKKSIVTSKMWSMVLYQLWLQLPPSREEGEVEYQNIQPEDLPKINDVKVIAGTYKGQTSPLRAPYSMTYLDVQLKAGEQFEFQTPKEQTTGFVFPRAGKMELYGENLPLNQLSILEENEGLVKAEAATDSAFVLIMAKPQHYPILAQHGSIHANAAAMERSFERIQKIGAVL